jgi:23S rRNA (uracil1939-C5)-methyltransferase
MKPGSTLELLIEKPAAGGRMIARHDGAVILVAGAIPGETVEARVERVQRGTGWAAVTRVLEASPDRVPAHEDWTCGGAVFSHIAYARQLVLKGEIVADAFARIGKMTLPSAVETTPSPREGYRLRARLHVRGGRIGFFREGTHEWCDPARTRQLLPATLAVIRRLEEMVRNWPGQLVSDVVVSENVPAAERLLHLELAPGKNPGCLPRLDALDGASGISASPLDSVRVTQVAGRGTLSDDLTVETGMGRHAFRLTRHAQSFFQGNRFLLQPLLDAVMREVPAGPLLDLYAGVGLFSAAAAARGDNAIAVEGDRHAAGDLKANAAAFDERLRGHHQAVEAFPARGVEQPIAAAIVDPPRTGLSPEALSGLLALRVPRIVYVSCDVATLARDARRLCDAGYRFTQISGFDLFPDTAHIEALAVFEQ